MSDVTSGSRREVTATASTRTSYVRTAKAPSSGDTSVTLPPDSPANCTLSVPRQHILTHRGSNDSSTVSANGPQAISISAPPPNAASHCHLRI
jgi:hypothetical protein